MNKVSHAVLVTMLIILWFNIPALPRALASSTAPGFAVTTVATGFPARNSIGPTGLAFDSSNTLYVVDYTSGSLYTINLFGATGGSASIVTQVNAAPIPGVPVGLAFGKDGRLYATLHSADTVVELNPSTGAIVRTVATGIPTPTGIATDPLSGDLFVSEQCTGCAPAIVRISNVAQGAGTVTAYASSLNADGLTFGPDGTLYAADQFNNTLVKIAGTDQTKPGMITPLGVSVPSIDGIAVAAGPDPRQPPFLLANRNDGSITKIDLSTSPPTLMDIVTGGTRGDFTATGPDGCFYATQSTSIVKVTNADGSCATAPTSAVPQLGLAPAAVPSSRQRGTTQVFTATLSNVRNPSGTTITFTMTGANAQTVAVRADASGTAAFSDRGVNAGTDSVVATARVGTASLTSNVGIVTWTDVSPPPSSTASVTPPSSTASVTPPSSTTLAVGLSSTPSTTPAVGASSTPTALSGQGRGTHRPAPRYTAPPALYVVMQPLLVRPGAIQRVVISYVKDALVHATVTFPGQRPLSLFGLTDTRARLTLNAMVPRNLTLRNGRATGQVFVQAVAGPWRQVALFLPVVRPGAIKRIAMSLPHSARAYVRVLVTFPGQPSRSLYDVTDAHGYAALNVSAPRTLARHRGPTVARVSVWVLSDRQHARTSRLLAISDMVVTIVPGPVVNCLRMETVHISYYAHVPVRITLLFSHTHRLVTTLRTDRYGSVSLRMNVEKVAHPTTIGVQVSDARPHVHRTEYTLIRVRPAPCTRAYA